MNCYKCGKTMEPSNIGVPIICNECLYKIAENEFSIPKTYNHVVSVKAVSVTKDTIINQLIDDELYEANKKFKPFASAHEGYAVLLEEYKESKNELKYINMTRKVLWRDIMANNSNEIMKERIQDIEYHSIRLIKEAIQVGAMCRKFKKLLEVDK